MLRLSSLIKFNRMHSFILKISINRIGVCNNILNILNDVSIDALVRFLACVISTSLRQNYIKDYFYPVTASSRILNFILRRVYVKMKNKLINTMIVLGSHVAYIISMGMGISFGILYSEIRNDFQISHSKASWVASLFIGLLGLAGICFCWTCRYMFLLDLQACVSVGLAGICFCKTCRYMFLWDL